MSRQWRIVISIVGVVVFALMLAVKVRPALALIEIGSRAPDFPATNLATNQPLMFEQYRGKVVLLNVWATWCAPCRIEMPSMQRLHEKFQGTDFVIVAVSIDREGPEVVNQFVKELGLTFDVLHDPTTDIERIYQTTGVPESFIIDRNGVIIKKVIGAAEWDGPVTEALVRRLLDAR